MAEITAAHAIPPYRLSLQQVLARPCRVGVARLIEKSESGVQNGHEVKCRFLVTRMLHGAPLSGTVQGSYFEGWPYRAPDRKVEAPIYTGSGLEHELIVGERYLFIVENDNPQTLLRVEPLSREAEVQALLSPR